MRQLKIIISILLSILASIGIAYFTEKHQSAGAGIWGGLNMIPLLLNAPAGLLMPLEVTQTVVFHILQSGRKNNGGEPFKKYGFWEKVLKFDPFANILVIVMCICGTLAAIYSPQNRRLEIFWKSIEETSSSSLTQFTSEQLPSFDGNSITIIKNMSELYLLENYDIIKVDGKTYERLKPLEASNHRWKTRRYIPITSWFLTCAHILFTYFMWKKNKTLTFKQSFLWLCVAVMGSGILLHVHSGTFTEVLFATGKWDIPSLISTLLGIWYVVVMIIFVTKEKNVHSGIKIWTPVLFVFATAVNGLIYNDEYYTNKNSIHYVCAMGALLLTMVLYSISRKEIAPQTEDDKKINIPWMREAEKYKS